MTKSTHIPYNQKEPGYTQSGSSASRITNHASRSSASRITNHASRIRRIYASLLMLVGLWSCETDINLISSGDPLPVVYCLLDPADSIQYVRVGSTYAVYPGDTVFQPKQDQILIDEDIVVYMAAEYPYYQQEIFYANLIDSIPKDSGWFPSSVNQIYALKCKIQEDTRYSLYVYFKKSGKIVHGETLSMGSQFTVIDPDLVPGREATLLPGIDFYVRFETVPNGTIFQSTMAFRYAEIRDGNRTNRSLVLPPQFI
jgi:hypothetical protein